MLLDKQACLVVLSLPTRPREDDLYCPFQQKRSPPLFHSSDILQFLFRDPQIFTVPRQQFYFRLTVPHRGPVRQTGSSEELYRSSQLHNGTL